MYKLSKWLNKTPQKNQPYYRTGIKPTSKRRLKKPDGACEAWRVTTNWCMGPSQLHSTNPIQPPRNVSLQQSANNQLISGLPAITLTVHPKGNVAIPNGCPATRAKR